MDVKIIATGYISNEIIRQFLQYRNTVIFGYTNDGYITISVDGKIKWVLSVNGIVDYIPTHMDECIHKFDFMVLSLIAMKNILTESSLFNGRLQYTVTKLGLQNVEFKLNIHSDDPSHGPLCEVCTNLGSSILPFTFNFNPELMILKSYNCLPRLIWFTSDWKQFTICDSIWEKPAHNQIYRIFTDQLGNPTGYDIVEIEAYTHLFGSYK